LKHVSLQPTKKQWTTSDTQKRGLEGTIIKAANAGWKDGKPTYQIKMKLEMDIDLRIVGFNYGSKGTRMSL
jgi:ATP-dependent DNA ligase